MLVKVHLLVSLLLLVLLSSTSAWALHPQEDSPFSLRQKKYAVPELRISPSHVPLEKISQKMTNGVALQRFYGRYGKNFRFYIDPRSGSPASIIGSIPVLPGSGKNNHITHEQLAQSLGRPMASIDAKTAAGAIRKFAQDNQDILNIDPTQLGAERAEHTGENLWQVSVPQEVKGVPVRNSRIVATINHGNMVLIGTDGWGNAKIDVTPKISADEATEIGFKHVDGRMAGDQIKSDAKLEIVAVASSPTEEEFTGTPGEGYQHRLVWTFAFVRQPDPSTWEIMVDAHSGEVLSFKDINQYSTAEMVGGVYPLSNTGIAPTMDTFGIMQSYSMPFANTGLPAPWDFTNSAGLFDYTSGNVVTTLSGKYLRVNDSCGQVRETSAGNLNLGGVNGQHDCDLAGASPGDTAAARSVYYEVNKLQEIARGYLPAVPWLQTSLGANVNLAMTCNAYWNGSTLNFYRSGGGCGNTGELASVFDHEWGHGLDNNLHYGGYSNPSESFADVTALYRTQSSCLGHGFFSGIDSGCGKTSDGTGYNANESQTGGSHCALDCSGVRDADWDRHEDHTPDTVANFVCGQCGRDAYGGNGPAGREVHCESAVDRQAAWDFAARDLRAAPFSYDSNTAFLVASRIFYAASGNIGDWHTGSCTTKTSSGCGASNAYLQWLAADDDDGDLNNGTPHMTALYNAFNRHGIACDTPAPVNGGCSAAPAAPTLATASGDHQVGLAWNAVAGAAKYQVFRSEGFAGCDVGKALIGTVTGSESYTDTGLGNGRQYCYSIMPVGDSEACLGRASACVCETPYELQVPRAKVQGRVTRADSGSPVIGALVALPGGYSSFTDDAGFYQISGVPVGSDLTVSAFGYYTQTVTGAVAGGGMNTVNIALVSLPTTTVNGTVKDGSGHGWPLSAKVAIVSAGPPVSSTTDPVSGTYSVTLFQNTSYTMTVTADGYVPSVRAITLPADGSVQDFSLAVDASLRTAPGYGYQTVFFDDFENGSANWTVSGQWHLQGEGSGCGTHVPPFPGSGNAMYYGQDAGCTYQTGFSANRGSLTMANSVPIGDNARLSFWSYGNTYNGRRHLDLSYDGGMSWVEDLRVWEGGPEEVWGHESIDLSGYSGANIQVRFRLDSRDGSNNAYFGWMIDEVAITQGSYAPLPGGLVVGSVADARGAKIGNALVRGGTGHSAPTKQDGYYQLFAPVGSSTLSAVAPGNIASESRSVNVAAGTVQRQDFALADCSYELPAATASFTAAGGTATIQVTSAASCRWNSTSDLSWVSLAAASNGTGNGTVSYTVAPNPDFTPRSGTITIAGQSFAVTQSALPQGVLTGVVTDSATGRPVTIATVSAGGASTMTDGAGVYRFAVISAGPHDLVVSKYGYQQQSVSAVVTEGATTSQPVALVPLVPVTLQGTVSDGSGHGWPLSAAITVTAPGFSQTVNTDAATGSYTITVFPGITYQVAVTASGYATATRSVTPSTGANTENFSLLVASAPCIASGYSSASIYLQPFEANDGGYSVSGSAPWAYGEPNGGPGHAHSGSKVWAVRSQPGYGGGHLTSRAIDLSSNAGMPSTLSWWQWLDRQGWPYPSLMVEFSNNGGASWSSPSAITSDVSGAWNQYVVALDPSYSVANFMVRFDFSFADYTLPGGWSIDDVTIQNGSCQAQHGGLVVGHTSIGGSNAGQVTVTDGNGHTATSGSYPDYGAYTLFLQAGSTTLSASGQGYGASKTINVVPETVQRVDLPLSRCSYTLVPGTASFPASGGSGTIQVVTGGGCSWNVTGVPNWVTISSTGSASGTGTVTYSVAPTQSASTRAGSLTIAGTTFAISQNGAVFGALTGTVTDSVTGNPLAGATVIAGGYATTTDSSGVYRFPSMVAVSYDVTVSAYGHSARTISGVAITSGGSATQDVALDPLPTVTVSGAVVDASGHNWPLHATLRVTAPGYTSTVSSDPVTGAYSISLYQGTSYSVTATAPGYDATTRQITASSAAEDFALSVTQSPCTAPGYGDMLYRHTFEDGDGGFTPVAVAGKGNPWQLGGAPVGHVPSAAHSGLKLWGTSPDPDNSYSLAEGYLTSPAIDLSANAGHSSMLSWWQAFYESNFYPGSVAVEVSKDDGASWSTVYGPVTGLQSSEGWAQPVITLDPSYAVSNFRFRFHYDSSVAYSEGWYIDDVSVQRTDCAPKAGGLMVGTVVSADTGAGINGATVGDGAGHAAVTAAAESDGFYLLFQPPGSYTVAASLAGYAPVESKTIEVTDSAVQRRDFTLSSCTFAIAPSASTFAASGNSGTVAVSTGGGCSWQSGNAPSWITITPGGVGPGTADLTVAPNTSHAARTATITIAGQPLTVTQAAALYVLEVTAGTGVVTGGGMTCTGSGCKGVFNSVTSVTLSALAPEGYGLESWSGCDSVSGTTCNVTLNADRAITASFTPCYYNYGWGWDWWEPQGGTRDITFVTNHSDCRWTVTKSSDADWLSILTADSGTGNGSFTYAVAPNASHESRDRSFYIKGKMKYEILQYGASYTLSVAPTPTGAGSVSGSGISCPGVCSQQVTPGSNTSLTAYPATGYYLNGWSGCSSASGNSCTVMADADKTIGANFAACSYALAPGSASFAASGGTGSFQVSTLGACYWTATSNASWLTITSGGKWPGNGTVTYTVSATTSHASRTGTITVGGQTVTITQYGTPGTLSVSVTPSGGGNVSASGISCPGVCSAQYPSENIVTLVATPATGYAFAGWNGCDTPAGTSCNMRINADKAVTATFSMNYQPAVITLSSLPPAMDRSYYRQFLTVSGGLAPFTWSISSGSLPAGLSINPSTGEISGLATAPGSTSNFTVQLADATTSVTRDYSITAYRQPAGVVWDWGQTTGNHVPVATSLDAVTSLAAATSVKYDGSVWSWTSQIPGLTDVISAGTNKAVKSDGTVWSYSSGGVGGQIAGLSGATAIDPSSTVVLKKDGTVWTWVNGVLLQVPGVSDAIAACSGYDANYLVKKDGTVWSWAATNSALTLTQKAGIGGVVAIAGGGTHTLVLKNDGTVWAWGRNYYGQLGNNSDFDSTTPVRSIGLTDVVAVAAGYRHSLAVKRDGTLWGWGSNFIYQLGLGNANNVFTPVQVTGISGVIGVSATGNDTFAIRRVPVAIQTAQLSDAATATPYSAVLSAQGGALPYAWSVASGTLPAGLSLDRSTGAITGIPAVSGTTTFTVQVVDASGFSASKTFTLGVYAPLALSPLPAAACYQGAPCSIPVTATGGKTPYAFTISAGALPGGLSLNPGTGVISGTPTAVGTSEVTLQVADANSSTANRTLSITVYLVPAIATGTLPDGYLTMPYSQSLSGSGGVPPYTWSIVGGALPAGLTLDASTGAIGGIPTAAGTSTFTVQLADANTASTTKNLTIAAYGLPSVTSTALPAAISGTAYSQTLAVGGGKAPFSWSIVAGALPAGLSLSTSGVVSGIAAAPGTGSCTVRATDANGMAAEQSLTVNVYAPLTITTATLSDGYLETGYSQTATGTGGLPPLHLESGGRKLAAGAHPRPGNRRHRRHSDCSGEHHLHHPHG